MNDLPKPTKHQTEFGKLHADGTFEHVRFLSQEAMMQCPHYIMVPDHYRDDESCRCDDPLHVEMKEWGYKWNDKLKRWT